MRKRLRRRLLAGGARRQVDDAVERAVADGAQGGEHGRRRLAAAGGRFHQQLFAVAKRPVDTSGEAPLTVPELGERERQPGQTRIAPLDARRCRRQPGGVGRDRVREKLRQRVVLMRLFEMRRGAIIRIRVQVDQAQPPRFAVGRGLFFHAVREGRIQLELGHVQMTDMGVQARHLGARGLVFLDQTRAIVDAVDPAPDAERDAVARDGRRHRHFPPIAFALRLRPPLRADALRGGGAARVAIVDIAPTMHECRQITDGDRGSRQRPVRRIHG